MQYTKSQSIEISERLTNENIFAFFDGLIETLNSIGACLSEYEIEKLTIYAENNASYQYVSIKEFKQSHSLLGSCNGFLLYSHFLFNKEELDKDNFIRISYIPSNVIEVSISSYVPTTTDNTLYTVCKFINSFINKTFKSDTDTIAPYPTAEVSVINNIESSNTPPISKKWDIIKILVGGIITIIASLAVGFFTRT